VAFRPTIARGLALSAICLFNQPKRCNLNAKAETDLHEINPLKRIGFQKE
jgi:hypothetical protein